MRDVNEQIQSAARGFASHRFHAVCECSSTKCIRTFSITMEEYDAVRAHAARFALTPGHEDTTLERVVQRNERFVVVEKVGEGRAVAEDLDPRG